MLKSQQTNAGLTQVLGSVRALQHAKQTTQVGWAKLAQEERRKSAVPADYLRRDKPELGPLPLETSQKGWRRMRTVRDLLMYLIHTFLSIFTINIGLSLGWSVFLWGLRLFTEESFDEALEFRSFLLDSQAIFEDELLVLKNFPPSLH